MQERTPGSRSRATWQQLRSRGSMAAHLAQRLDDVITNQAFIAQSVAKLELDHLSRPCADAPLESRVCRQADLGAEHAQWCDDLGEPLVLSRKAWEYTALCRALDAAGLLHSGARGLGFGVGREPMVASFASRGVEVVATDLPPKDPRSRYWSSSGQQAATLAGLSTDKVSEDVLRDKVTLRGVDMTDVPDDLVDFDFVWSACAMEHLGSLEAGTRFVERSLDCLRPGGLAVHTTEYNLDSDTDTREGGPTVLYRRADLAGLLERLASRGHGAGPFLDGDRSGVLDYIVDVQPYHYASLVVRFAGYRITSAILIVRKAGD